MPRKTCFNKSWLSTESVDSNGDILSDWCSDVKSDSFSAYCEVCRKTFSIANMGSAPILSHAHSEKLKTICCDLSTALTHTVFVCFHNFYFHFVTLS
jgi:hypothetical protein